MFRSPEDANFQAREGVRVWFDTVPNKYIADVQVNPVARSVTSADFAPFLNEDTIKKMTCMSVSAGIGDYVVNVSRAYGRSVPLYYGDFSFHRTVGGIIKAKGCSISGERYTWPPDASLFENMRHSPQGLFGTTDARWETEISNELLLAGFRTTLPFATVVFDEGVRGWLLQNIRDPAMQKVIDRSFALVKEHGDTPAYILHIAGTQERSDVVEHSLYAPNSHMDDIMRGAGLLQAELHMDGSLMQKYMRMIGHDIHISQGISSIANGRHITYEQFLGYRTLLTAIYAANHYAMERVAEARSARGADWNISPADISAPKDVDMAFFSTDYEHARSNIAFPLDGYDDVVQSFIRIFLVDYNTYHDQLKWGTPSEVHAVEGRLLSWVTPEDRARALEACEEQQIREEYAHMLPIAYQMRNK